jgi:hypothetical protein
VKRTIQPFSPPHARHCCKLVRDRIAIDDMAGPGAAACLRGLVVVLAVSVSLWGAAATINVKETCQFTAHPNWCEKALSKLVSPEGGKDGGASPSTAPTTTT